MKAKTRAEAVALLRQAEAKLRAKEAELKRMDGFYATLRADNDALWANFGRTKEELSKAIAERDEARAKVKADELGLETEKWKAKAADEQCKRESEMAEAWKAFAVDLAMALHAIGQVVEGRTSDEAIAARLLVEAAKKKKYPAREIDNIWKWGVAALLPLGFLAYTLFKTGAAVARDAPETPPGGVK